MWLLQLYTHDKKQNWIKNGKKKKKKVKYQINSVNFENRIDWNKNLHTGSIKWVAHVQRAKETESYVQDQLFYQ